MNLAMSAWVEIEAAWDLRGLNEDYGVSAAYVAPEPRIFDQDCEA